MQIIDRRLNGKNKSAVNRQRFIRRFKRQIAEAAAQAINGRSITDVDRGERVNIPARDVLEPRFRRGAGGRRVAVHPGNREFSAGDRLTRPQGGADGNGEKSSDGEGGQDSFGFELSREEFLELFFADLELPDLEHREVSILENTHSVRAGFTVDGVPSNINIVRSLRSAIGRRMALKAPAARELAAAQTALETLEGDDEHLEGDALTGASVRSERDALKDHIGRLERRVAAVPFVDTFDLRYNNRVAVPAPSSNAVMFCLMDVSGSMDESRKDIAKRFFSLLYLFLKRSYEKIDVVFIRHHTSAKEVDEQEFFYARETGGTVVSSGLSLMAQIIAARYPSSAWNVYGAQASDGDNWGDDSSLCKGWLDEKILPLVQYFAYVEIRAERRQSLWETYAALQSRWTNLAMQEIRDVSDIYPVFRRLLKKREA
ncbi:MAG: uncharacterized sporulation protein YeaH/YhbH (DUF444 family) [Gammaproteobacteria bacterium]|jgi:uncharacterized sporulation protein YeaH/YhbH (DUF444 family)